MLAFRLYDLLLRGVGVVAPVQRGPDASTAVEMIDKGLIAPAPGAGGYVPTEAGVKMLEGRGYTYPIIGPGSVEEKLAAVLTSHGYRAADARYLLGKGIDHQRASKDLGEDPNRYAKGYKLPRAAPGLAGAFDAGDVFGSNDAGEAAEEKGPSHWRKEHDARIGEAGQVLSAASVLKGAGASIPQGDMLWWYPRSRRWAFEAPGDQKAALKAGRAVQKALIARRALASSLPWFGNLDLVVFFDDGEVSLPAIKPDRGSVQTMPGKVEATKLNVQVMYDELKAHGGKIPARIEMTALPHLRRDIEAGLLQRQSDGTYVPTDRGIDMMRSMGFDYQEGEKALSPTIDRLAAFEKVGALLERSGWTLRSVDVEPRTITIEARSFAGRGVVLRGDSDGRWSIERTQHDPVTKVSAYGPRAPRIDTSEPVFLGRDRYDDPRKAFEAFAAYLDDNKPDPALPSVRPALAMFGAQALPAQLAPSARDRVIEAIARHHIVFASPGDQDRVMVVARPHVQEISATTLGVPQTYVGTNDEIADWLVARGFTEDGEALRRDIDRRRRPLVEGAIAPSADAARELSGLLALARTEAYRRFVREIMKTAMAESKSPDEAEAEVRALSESPHMLIDMGSDALPPATTISLKGSIWSPEARKLAGHKLAEAVLREIETVRELGQLATHLNESAAELDDELRLGNITEEEHAAEVLGWRTEMALRASEQGLDVDFQPGKSFHVTVLWKGR